jgi:hypothetical protein
MLPVRSGRLNLVKVNAAVLADAVWMICSQVQYMQRGLAEDEAVMPDNTRRI